VYRDIFRLEARITRRTAHKGQIRFRTFPLSSRSASAAGFGLCVSCFRFLFFMRLDFPMDVRYADIGGYSLAYAEAGQGTPVLLIHGSLCDLRYWKPQMAALARDFRVFSVSLRRYWPERWDGVGDGFSVAQHVRDMAAFIEHIGAGPAHVAGHSRGGRVAFELARAHAGLVRSAVLADPGLPLSDTDDARDGFRKRALECIRRGDVDGGLALFIDTVSGADTWRRMVPWFKEMVLDNANTLFGQAHEAPYQLTGDGARSLDKPVLLIGGALSPPPYPAILDALQAWLPDSRRIDIAGSSHGMNLGNPRAFNEALRTFLAPPAGEPA
jgi:pimeloyl-ACP methyl ester carboxylesterase